MILVVDDDPGIREAFRLVLEEEYELIEAADGPQALRLVHGSPVDLVLLDVRLPGMDGIEVLERIKAIDDHIEVVLVTAFQTVRAAVAAMKLGALDYLTKPFDEDEILPLIRRALERRALDREVVYLRSELARERGFDRLVGHHPLMQQLYQLISAVAGNPLTVLIAGESGTGKELVAAAIHRLSSRAKRPFIPVNCSAIPQDLLESEFFGHVRGAFSGAVADALGLFRGADEGTIFLDEIAELSPALQVKLLRVLQEMQVRPVGSTKAFPVDVRVIAATNRDLERAMTEGSFRQDLFYRLNVVRVTLPPLRERREDIPSLINHFLRRFNKRFHRDVRGVAPEALAALTAYTFPGNVRELENLIERAFAMGAREQISLTDLPSLSKTPMTSTPVTSPESVPALADVERELILKALAVFKDDKEAAARALGISRRTIYRRLKEYGVL